MDLERAGTHIEAAQEEADALGEDHFMQLLLIQASIHAETGAMQAAFELASQVLQMAQASGLSEEEVEAYRALGRLHRLTGEYMKAESLLRQSLDLSRQRRIPYQEGLALLELGLLYQVQFQERQWRRNELTYKAEEVLVQATEAFERLGAQHDLQTVQRLRQELREAALPATIPDFANVPATKHRERVIAGGHENTGERHTVSVVWLQLLPGHNNGDNLPTGKDDNVLQAIREVTSEVSAVALALEGKMLHQPGGVCILFGLNGMHVDDPERAMRAAWHLRQTFTDRGERLPISLQYSVTVGEVTTGRFAVPVTSEAAGSSDPVQEAARIAQQAEPDRIWVTQTVRALTQHLFIFAHSTENGIAEATQMQAMPDLQQRLTDMTGAFIGRASLLESMLQVAQHLPNNEGGIIWLEGEGRHGYQPVDARAGHQVTVRGRKSLARKLQYPDNAHAAVSVPQPANLRLWPFGV
ncbi:MAG: tetratricopeptide repeat protein [Caldilineaceae bacterium]